MKGRGSGWKGESRRHSLARKGIRTGYMSCGFEQKKAGTTKTQLAMFGGIYEVPVKTKTMKEIVYGWFSKYIETEQDLNYFIEFMKNMGYVKSWFKKDNLWVIDGVQGMVDMQYAKRNPDKFRHRIINRMGKENYNKYKNYIEAFVEGTL